MKTQVKRSMVKLPRNGVSLYYGIYQKVIHVIMKKSICKSISLHKKHNNQIDKALEILSEVVKAETGDENIVPNDYKEHRKSWDELWARNHQGSYPFSEENLKEFCSIYDRVRGFQIC